MISGRGPTWRPSTPPGRAMRQGGTETWTDESGGIAPDPWGDQLSRAPGRWISTPTHAKLKEP